MEETLKALARWDETTPDRRAAMNRADTELLIDRWMNDPGFRTQMRQDPVATARQAGITVEAEDEKVLRSTDWTLSDEELADRISMRFRFR
jgi:hypothetical protein